MRDLTSCQVRRRARAEADRAIRMVYCSGYQPVEKGASLSRYRRRCDRRAPEPLTLCAHVPRYPPGEPRMKKKKRTRAAVVGRKWRQWSVRREQEKPQQKNGPLAWRVRWVSHTGGSGARRRRVPSGRLPPVRRQAPGLWHGYGDPGDGGHGAAQRRRPQRMARRCLPRHRQQGARYVDRHDAYGDALDPHARGQRHTSRPTMGPTSTEHERIYRDEGRTYDANDDQDDAGNDDGSVSVDASGRRRCSAYPPCRAFAVAAVLFRSSGRRHRRILQFPGALGQLSAAWEPQEQNREAQAGARTARPRTKANQPGSNTGPPPIRPSRPGSRRPGRRAASPPPRPGRDRGSRRPAQRPRPPPPPPPPTSAPRREVPATTRGRRPARDSSRGTQAAPLRDSKNHAVPVPAAAAIPTHQPLAVPCGAVDLRPARRPDGPAGSRQNPRNQPACPAARPMRHWLLRLCSRSWSRHLSTRCCSAVTGRHAR